MYFNAETQARILRRFHFALDDAGFLFLGKSEMLLTHARPVRARRPQAAGVRARSPRATLRDRVLRSCAGGRRTPRRADGRRTAAARRRASTPRPSRRSSSTREGALAPPTARARALFGLGAGDLGRPLQDLEVSYRPVELRAPLEQACAERPPRSRSASVGLAAPGGERATARRRGSRRCSPDGDARGRERSRSATSTAQRALESELEASRRELETAYEELQSTVEELETTNEELQSTNEELETTNEELQSTNEELETMNEELQSTNEELETINDELRQRTLELNEVNAFLETILTAHGRRRRRRRPRQRVQVWNRDAEELWGLRADEVAGPAPPRRSTSACRSTAPRAAAIFSSVRGRAYRPRDLAPDRRRNRALAREVTSRAAAGRTAADDVAGAVVLAETAPALTAGGGGVGRADHAARARRGRRSRGLPRAWTSRSPAPGERASETCDRAACFRSQHRDASRSAVTRPRGRRAPAPGVPSAPCVLRHRCARLRGLPARCARRRVSA